jgi:pyruvate,orthophosphate dikinase
MPYVTKMILARNIWERKQALLNLIPMQKEDFLGIFRTMEGKKVNIRLLDPPLHEYLPSQESLALEIERARVAMNVKEMEEKEKLLKRIKILHESNPAFGHRGCRMGITYPEIYEIQARIIAYAALELKKENVFVYPQIIVPLLSHSNEMKEVREIVTRALEEVFAAMGDRIDIPIGAFLELPRACITADKIVHYADFFIFGTNDLTSSTFAFSRDDAEGKYLAYYLDHKILPENPFVVLDQEGVGELIKIGIEKGKKVKPDLSIGICGEHTSEPSSVEFMQENGMEFISCLPHLIPAGKIAAAQAAIKAKMKGKQNNN